MGQADRSGCGWLMVVTMGMVALGIAGRGHADAPSRVLPKLMDRATVKAIDRGLNYLAKTQRRDGSWLNQGGYGSHPEVMSSLSGLGLMAGGSTPKSGPYAKNVRRAMLYILRVGENSSSGYLCGSSGQLMYSHGFSMLFLATCYGCEADEETEKRLKKVLDKAVKMTGVAQSKPNDISPGGGWCYTPSSGDEGSVTVTQLQALRACRNAGIRVGRDVIDKSVRYLKFCQNGDGGISYCASSRGSSRPAISAAAITCFYSAGLYDRVSGGRSGESRMVDKLIQYCKRNVTPEMGGGYSGYYFYTQLYMAQAMYTRGGRDWARYFPALAGKLRSMQAPDGSWDGDSIGTTYGTAIATIVLQLPYGYLPIVQR